MVAKVDTSTYSLVQVSTPFTNHKFYYRVKRAWNFCRQPNNELLRNSFFGCIAGGVAAGAEAGNELGRKVESLVQAFNGEDERDEEDNHFGGLVGKVVGGFIGGTFGLWGGVKVIENIPDYQDWVGTSLRDVVRNAIDSLYKDDIILKHFCCPLSTCIIYDPVHTVSGRICDSNSLKKPGQALSENLKDPYTREPFHLHTLPRDHEMAFVTWKRIYLLMTASFKKMPESDEKNCFDKNLKEIEKLLDKYYNSARDAIETRRKEKTITNDIYKREIGEFEQLFGADESQELNWELDWKSTLIDRWKYFHPGAKVYWD